LQQTKTNNSQRQEMVLYAIEHGITPAAQKFNTSTKTVAKWLKRYQTLGLAGLQDVVRILPAHPHCKITPAQLNDAILLKQSQPKITAKEIIAKLNFSCSEGLLYRKLRSALNSGESFYNKALTRKLKEKTAGSKEFTPFYFFSRKVNTGGETLFITGAINLHNGMIYLCYSSEQSGLNFTVFADYLLYRLTVNSTKYSGLLFITGHKNNTLFLSRLFAKYQLNNPVFKERAAAYVQRHFSEMSVRLDNLFAEISSIQQHESIESRLLYLIADYNSNITQDGKSKLLYPVQLSNFISDTEIIVEKSDYWQSVSLFSSTLTSQIALLEEQKNQWLEKAQYEKALQIIEDILLLKESFGLKQNSQGDLLYKKIALLKNLGRIEEALDVFAELFDSLNPVDRLDYLATLIEKAEFHATVNQPDLAIGILEKISSEIFALDNQLLTGDYFAARAMIKSRQNRYWQTTLLYSKALKTYGLCGCSTKTTAVYLELLQIFTIKGDFAKARQFGCDALQYADSSGDLRLKAQVCGELGNLYFQYNSMTRAREYFEQSMEIYKNCNDIFGIINTYMKLGNVYTRSNDYAKALPVYQQVIDLSRQHGFNNLYYQVLNNRGIAFSNTGDYHAAEADFKSYLSYLLERKDKNRIAGAYGNLGLLYQEMDKIPAALSNFKKALELSRETGFKHLQTAYLLNFAKIYFAQHKYKPALRCAVEAVNVAIAISQPDFIFHTRLIKIRISWAIAYKKRSEKSSLRTDFRPVHALAELYHRSNQLNEKILAGFSLWETLSDLNRLSLSANDRNRTEIARILQQMPIQNLANELLDLLNSLSEHEKKYDLYQQYRKALSVE